jgi:predicted DNA-binding ribbon-helix-helix protein
MAPTSEGPGRSGANEKGAGFEHLFERAPSALACLSGNHGRSVCSSELYLYWYLCTLVPMSNKSRVIERVQTGVRIEKRLLKVLKALAEYHDMTLGDLLEGIVLHAFDGKCAFQASSLTRIRNLKQFYDLDLDASASHRLIEVGKTQTLRNKKRRT